MMLKALYLDFDGVLHPGDASNGLFEHAPLLEQMLEPYPELRIVLSTSWAELGYQLARGRLPAGLADRCIGSTFQNDIDLPKWRRMSRGERVLADFHRRQPTTWLAIDDNNVGWGQNLEHVVITDPIKGISDPVVLELLKERLRRFQ